MRLEASGAGQGVLGAVHGRGGPVNLGGQSGGLRRALFNRRRAEHDRPMEAGEPPTSRFSISAYDGSLDVNINDLTLSANAVLTSANSLCEELRNSRVEPCHVAYRLYVDDVAGVGGQILARAGAEPGPVKAALQELINGLTVSQAAFSGRGVTFSQPFVELIKNARKEQRLTSDKVIGLDHIALACADESVDSLEILGRLGLGPANVRGAVEKLKGSPQVVSSPRESPEGEISPAEQLAQLTSDDAADDESLYDDY